MAWGAAGGRGVDDLVARLVANDRALQSLTLLRSRRFGPAEVAALSGALRRNTTLTELQASGHALSADSAAVLADALRENGCLRSLCVGDAQLGAQFRAHA